MAGLIANTLDNGQKSYGAATAPYDASLRTVDPATETVAGQLSKVLDSGSPYLQRAQANALDTANSRGLINTSMAAGAGTAAAIDAALPVASADAATYSNTAAANQGATNTASQFNSGAENTANLNEANAANTSQLSTQQTGQQKELIGTQTGAQKELAQQAADIQTGQVLPATTQAQQEIIGTQAGAQKELQEQSGQIQSGLSAQQAGQSLNLLTAQGQEQSRLQSEASDQKIKQLVASGQQDQALQVLKGSQATTLANIESSYKSLIQANASASSLYNNSTQLITAVMADPNTSIEQKQSGVNTITSMLQSGLTVVGSIANIDIAGLLNFEGA